MDKFSVAALVPLGSAAIVFGWLTAISYFKVLRKREEVKREELSLRKKALQLEERKAEKEWEFHERELEYKYRALEHHPQKSSTTSEDLS